jgi:hypothetical protein
MLSGGGCRVDGAGGNSSLFGLSISVSTRMLGVKPLRGSSRALSESDYHTKQGEHVPYL